MEWVLFGYVCVKWYEMVYGLNICAWSSVRVCTSVLTKQVRVATVRLFRNVWFMEVRNAITIVSVVWSGSNSSTCSDLRARTPLERRRHSKHQIPLPLRVAWKKREYLPIVVQFFTALRPRSPLPRQWASSIFSNIPADSSHLPGATNYYHRNDKRGNDRNNNCNDNDTNHNTSVQ